MGKKLSKEEIKKKQEQKEEITRIVAIIFSFIGVFYFFIKLLFL